MASLAKRAGPQGVRWQAQVRRKGHPPAMMTFRTRAEAERWAKSVEAEMDAGRWNGDAQAKAAQMTLKSALDRYQVEVTVDKRSHRAETGRIRVLQGLPFAQMPMNQIDSAIITSALRQLQTKRKITGSTLNRYHAILSHLFTIADKDWGLPLRNAAKHARKAKENRARDRRLRGDEEQRLIAACQSAQNPYLLYVLQFAADTAMRMGEFLETVEYENGKKITTNPGLRWTDFHQQDCILHIPRTKLNNEPRDVPLSSRAMQILLDVRKIGNPRRRKIFDTTYNAIKLSFGRACTRAGIEDLRLHDLRHEGASRLFERGLNVMEVATITGHRSVQTLKRYVQLDPKQLVSKLG